MSVVTFQHPTMKNLACAYCVCLIVVLMLLGAGMKGEYPGESSLLSPQKKNHPATLLL